MYIADKSQWKMPAILLLALLIGSGACWYGFSEDAQSPPRQAGAEQVWGTRDGAATGLAGESPYASERKGYVVAVITGNWVGALDMGAGNRVQFSFNLSETGGQLSGTATFPIGAGSIEDGKVVGNQLWFSTRHQLPSTGQILLTKFSGELTDDALNLTMLSEGTESKLTLTPARIP